MVLNGLRLIVGFAFFIHFSCSVYAETGSSDSLQNASSFYPNWKVAGFVDSYYAADLLGQTPGQSFQPFLFNHNRNRSFQLNLAMVKMAVSSDYYRATVHLQTGTYAMDNYAAEPVLYRSLFEAYAGIALNSAQTLWLDMGLFESHIGYESAISIKNYTLTRSLMAENSPYFLTGARLTFEPNEQWLFRLILCNGWQRIRRPNEQQWPSFGTQAEYKWGASYTLNWSTYFGSEFPLGEARQRVFNSIYLRRDLPKKLSWILGFDLGLQEDLAGVDQMHSWYAASALISYPFRPAWKIGLRMERFSDPRASIIAPNFSAWAGSINVDYQPVSQIALRIELKILHSDQALQAALNQLLLTTSIAAQIGK
jgi:hypothetical protein